MPLATLCLALFVPSAAADTTLARKFVVKEKLAYTVHSHLTAEERQQGLLTWIPSDVDIDYPFSYTVEALKADGFAQIKYLRPTWTVTEGETSDSVPKPKIDKLNQVLQILVSPVNELTEVKDITPKKKPVKKKPTLQFARRGAAPVQAPIFGEYVGEVHRLALFVGGIDSSLDFAPKLPLEAVKIGDTWKRTIGYQPQKLKGKDGKSAVQRLDYVYSYVGPMMVDGKPILRVQAKLDFSTDLVEYLKSIAANQDFGIRTMPLNLKATIDFDLDPKTRHTLHATAVSEGGFKFLLKGQDDAYEEERFKGQTDLTLAGRKIGAK